uniref:Uncharacterized protein n=1 Tax=Anguilla anguilla TaxID=7936 RepID=A0A0E9SK79_ANGAN
MLKLLPRNPSCYGYL